MQKGPNKAPKIKALNFLEVPEGSSAFTFNEFRQKQGTKRENTHWNKKTQLWKLKIKNKKG